MSDRQACTNSHIINFWHLLNCADQCIFGFKRNNNKLASEACPKWKSVVRPHAISNPPLLPSPFPTQSSSVSLTNSADIANRVQHVTRLWLAIRFKITTGYTRVFLPRILVNIRYVWALSSYIRPFRSRIYAFLNGHIFA